MRQWALLSVLAFMSIGCATGTPFEAVTPPQGQSVVYVYRPTSGYAGSGVTFTMKADNVKFGELQNDGYVYTFVPPGKHLISTSTESTAAIPFNAEPGKSYYIEASIQMGFWIGQPRLTMVPEETGKLAILGTKYFGNPAEAPSKPAAGAAEKQPANQTVASGPRNGK